MKIKTKLEGEVEVTEAEVLWAHQRAEANVEDDLQEVFDGPWQTYKDKNWKLTFSHIGYDDYDHSIELYVQEDAKFDEKKLLEALKEHGFTMGWINFDDGTEIHFHAGILDPRQKKDHPHWSKELKEQYEKGELNRDYLQELKRAYRATGKFKEEAYKEVQKARKQVEQLQAVLNDLPGAASEAGAKDGWVPFPHWEEFVNKVNDVLEDTK